MQDIRKEIADIAKDIDVAFDEVEIRFDVIQGQLEEVTDQNGLARKQLSDTRNYSQALKQRINNQLDSIQNQL